MSPDEGRSFENKIRIFLQDVGFDNVPEPNERFFLGGQEIDAFGRDGDFYVVVDAKTRTSLQSRGHGVRRHLSIINGYKDEVTREITERYGGIHGYRGIVFVFWTKTIRIDDEHKDRAIQLEIALRDDFDLKYYEDAYRALAERDIVRNSFLKDLSLQLPHLSIFTSGYNLTPRTIRTKSGVRTLYTFPITVRDLLKFAYVFRIETNSILGGSYQRLLKGRKVRSIRTYIRDRSGYFPNNLIAVSEEPLVFTLDEGQRADAAFVSGLLQLPTKPCYLEILDGQHRLYGYSNLPARQNHCLWITIVEGLTPKERATLFVKINRTQTPVPPDILWDLYQITDPGVKGRISMFVYTLNERQPFEDRIALPRVRSLTAYLSFSNFCVSLFTRSQLFSRFGDDSNFMNTITAFFAKIEDHPDTHTDWVRSIDNKGGKGFILTNNSISVLMRLLRRILDRTGIPPADRILSWKNHLDDWIVSSIVAYLGHNNSGDPEDPYQSLRRDLTSEGARKDAALEIWRESPLSRESFRVDY